MCPTILLPGKDKVVVRGPEDLIVTDNVAKDAALSLVGFPDLAACPWLNICDPNGPWLAGAFWTKSKGLAGGRRTNKSQLFAVARPDGIAIAIDTRIEITNLLARTPRRKIKDTNEAVISTRIDEGQHRAIRRQVQRIAATFRLHQQRRLCAAIDPCLPKISLVDVDNAVIFRNDDGGMTLGQLLRLSPIERYHPDELFRFFRVTVRIWVFAKAVQVAATRIDNSAPVVRP